MQFIVLKSSLKAKKRLKRMIESPVKRMINLIMRKKEKLALRLILIEQEMVAYGNKTTQVRNACLNTIVVGVKSIKMWKSLINSSIVSLKRNSNQKKVISDKSKLLTELPFLNVDTVPDFIECKADISKPEMLKPLQVKVTPNFTFTDRILPKIDSPFSENSRFSMNYFVDLHNTVKSYGVATTKVQESRFSIIT